MALFHSRTFCCCLIYVIGKDFGVSSFFYSVLCENKDSLYGLS